MGARGSTPRSLVSLVLAASMVLAACGTHAQPAFFFSSRRRHTRWNCDRSSDVCSSDLHQFGTEGEEIGTPGQTQSGCQPMRDAIGDLRVLQESYDDAEEAEDSSRSDQSAGIERAGTGFAFVLLLGGCFDQRADEAAGKHGSRGSDRKIGASGKG